MDEISNSKDDEIGLDYWTDFFCVLLIKNCKYGFFTNNGKFIEPAYESYTVDPCDGDIHVKTNKGYGLLASPDYIFEEVSEEFSLLAEISGEDFDEDGED